MNLPDGFSCHLNQSLLSYYLLSTIVAPIALTWTYCVPQDFAQSLLSVCFSPPSSGLVLSALGLTDVSIDSPSFDDSLLMGAAAHAILGEKLLSPVVQVEKSHWFPDITQDKIYIFQSSTLSYRLSPPANLLLLRLFFLTLVPDSSCDQRSTRF
jgi:hypothetical protein